MFDILAFLFEQYFTLDNCPDRGTLAKRLSAAGFEDQEIDEALDWLNEFEELDPTPYLAMDALPQLPRILHPREAARLTPDAQAFFHYLSSSGALGTGQRELLIDRLMQSTLMQLDESAVKRVALMVLWRHGDDLANLLIEELLFAGDAAPMH